MPVQAVADVQLREVTALCREAAAATLCLEELSFLH